MELHRSGTPMELHQKQERSGAVGLRIQASALSLKPAAYAAQDFWASGPEHVQRIQHGRFDSVLRNRTSQVRDRARLPAPRLAASSPSTASSLTCTSSPPQQRVAAKRPLGIADIDETFDVLTTVKGGGVNGQADAVKLGIARALMEFNIELRKTLKAEGLVTRDSRGKERKKYGQKGARARFQFSQALDRFEVVSSQLSGSQSALRWY